MAFRLADCLIEGYFNNLRANGTHGQLLLLGLDTPVHFGLTGNPDVSLRGRAFEFRARDPETLRPIDDDAFARHQIGPTGDMLLRMIKSIEGDPVDIVKGKVLRFRWRPCLYLEWYGQNGRVVIELEDPILTLVEGAPFPEPDLPNEESRSGFSVSVAGIKDDGSAEISTWVPREETGRHADDEGEESALDSYLEGLSRETEARLEGFDPEFLAEMKMVEGGRSEEEEFLGNLLHPQRLPAPEGLSEEEATVVVKQLLADLALLHVAVHLCEHCTMLEGYRYILGELLFEGRVHPELRNTGWVQNYNYGEDCPECIASIEAEMDRDERSKERGNSFGDTEE